MDVAENYEANVPWWSRPDSSKNHGYMRSEERDSEPKIVANEVTMGKKTK